MIIRFFKLPKHKTFTYKPRYYDPIKEEVAERQKLAEQELKEKDNYVPGSLIKGNLRRHIRSSRTDIKKSRFQALLIRVVLIAIIVAILYLVQHYL